MVCPLIALLDGGVQQAQMVKLESLDGSVTYTGFADFRDLEKSTVKFVPMNSNRAVNVAVVAERVEQAPQAAEKFTIRPPGLCL